MTVTDQPVPPAASRIQVNATKRERSAKAHERLRLAREMGFHSDRLHSHFHWRVTAVETLNLEALPERYKGRHVFDWPVNLAFEQAEGEESMTMSEALLRPMASRYRAYRSVHRKQAVR